MMQQPGIEQCFVCSIFQHEVWETARNTTVWYCAFRNAKYDLVYQHVSKQALKKKVYTFLFCPDQQTMLLVDHLKQSQKQVSNFPD